MTDVRDSIHWKLNKIMGKSTEKIEAAHISNEKPPEEKKKLKPCCACPETKRVRDACIIENGEEKCGSLIEAHKQCMRDMGFNI